MFNKSISDIRIGDISKFFRTLKPDTLTSTVCSMIDFDKNIPGFCIVDKDKVLGVLNRNHLYLKLSGLYGYSLFSNKPISEVMQSEFLSVDYDTSIDVVSDMAMNRCYENLYDFITVTKEGKYFGIVTVKDLLMKTISVEVSNATQLNPLSGLPGNNIIEHQLELALKSKVNPCILYLDLDNFKAYNDIYGFENGDRALKLLTKIIMETVNDESFKGHIGGDDFIVVVYEDNPKKIAESIISQFDDSISILYNRKDLERGYIISKNRLGREEFFPLLSLSIAGIRTENISNIYQLAETASELKKVCKKSIGSISIVK